MFFSAGRRLLAQELSCSLGTVAVSEIVRQSPAVCLMYFRKCGVGNWPCMIAIE
jgi:hypothetical protein